MFAELVVAHILIIQWFEVTGTMHTPLTAESSNSDSPKTTIHASFIASNQWFPFMIVDQHPPFDQRVLSNSHKGTMSFSIKKMLVSPVKDSGMLLRTCHMSFIVMIL